MKIYRKLFITAGVLVFTALVTCSSFAAVQDNPPAAAAAPDKPADTVSAPPAEKSANETVASPTENSAGETAASPVEKPAAAAGENPAANEPYAALVNGDNVNIRCGAAEIYYPVAQLKNGEKVIVHEEKQGWAKIEPTWQCFSYIAKKYVTIAEAAAGTSAEPAPTTAAAPEKPAATESAPPLTKESTQETMYAKPRTGVVNGDAVLVRAGSIKVPPAYAYVVQTKLNAGDKVQIIGERDDYYEIICPRNCFFYISLDFLKRSDSSNKEQLDNIRSEVNLTQQTGLIPGPAAPALSPERSEYQQLMTLVKTELLKPLPQRQYQSIKENLDNFLARVQSPSVKASALNLQRYIERDESILADLKQSQQLDDQLLVNLDQIDSKVQQLAAFEPNSTEKELVVQGRLEKSAVFSSTGQNQRLVVLDDNNKIIYYAISGSDALDLNQWLGKKVSMAGTAAYDAFGKVTIITVHRLVELPAPNK